MIAPRDPFAELGDLCVDLLAGGRMFPLSDAEIVRRLRAKNDELFPEVNDREGGDDSEPWHETERRLAGRRG